jgi:glyoxylase-like metal-dependent hydrolase (beta-lactamase superfamily II)
MRVHHLNCISSCPLGGALMDGRTVGLRGRLALHCLLLELPDRLVLVDTGFGLNDVANPRGRLSLFFRILTSPAFREEMTAIRQIEALGFDASDVSDIVLTHLDFDHAGGLDDFPHAKVHLLAAEEESAVARRTVMDRQRYRPQQWSTRANWIGYRAGGDRWFGFETVRSLRGLPPEILFVPLRGHTLGHAAVAIDAGPRWMLYAGDAYFHHGEMDLERPHCTPGLRFYQWMLEKDRAARLDNQHRLRELKRGNGSTIDLFSGHDVDEFERFAGRGLEVPALRAAPVTVPR